MRKIVVELGRIRTDMRFSAFIAKPPGHGGSAIKNSIIRILKGIEKVCVPTSRHEEQLVGKIIHIIVRGSEVVRKNFGYLKDAFVIFDEALPLILRHDDKYDKFWGYMNTALDTYGENLIEKRGVNDLEPISYFGELSAMFIMQPAKTPNSFISRGPFRRCIPLLIELPDHEKKEIISRRLRESRPSDRELKELQEYLRSLSSLKKVCCIYAPQVQDEIEKGTNELLELTRNNPSETVRQYGAVMHSTFPDLLLRMAVHIAIDDVVYGKTVYDPPAVFEEFETPVPTGPTIGSSPEIPVTVEHVQMAMRHIRLFMESAFDFIDRLVREPTKIPALSQQTHVSLSILKTWGCMNEETSTRSIGEYQKEIVKLLKCSESTARSICSKQRQKGFIDSKQIGSHSSRVWLTVEGMRILESENAR